MRFVKCYREIMECPRISEGARVTYSILRGYVGAKSNRVWPAQKTIAEKQGCSERTIRRHLQELALWSVIHPDWDQWDAAASNTYYLTDEKAAVKISRKEWPNGGHGCPPQAGHGCPPKEIHSKDSVSEEASEYVVKRKASA